MAAATILVYFAFVFAVIAALFVEVLPRAPLNIHFGWLAVALYILAAILGGHG